MMATVTFYEKPGCGNNTKQKAWLAASGHTVLAKSVLTEKWTGARLRPFFGDLPVAQWFNPSAPRVKSGEVNPAVLDAQTAIEMMIAEPLLIRRPLMDMEGELCVGFDPEVVNAWIGLNNAKPNGQDRSPLLNPLDETTSHSTRLQNTAAKSLVIPQAGEEANESLRDFHFNGDVEACPNVHARSPHPCPLGETTSHSTRLQNTAAKSLVIPLAVEGEKDSLREDYDHLSQPCPTPETPSPQSSPVNGRGGEREQPSSIPENSHA